MSGTKNKPTSIQAKKPLYVYHKTWFWLRCKVCALEIIGLSTYIWAHSSNISILHQKIKELWIRWMWCSTVYKGPRIALQNINKTTIYYWNKTQSNIFACWYFCTPWYSFQVAKCFHFQLSLPRSAPDGWRWRSNHIHWMHRKFWADDWPHAREIDKLIEDEQNWHTFILIQGFWTGWGNASGIWLGGHRIFFGPLSRALPWKTRADNIPHYQ